MMNVFACEAYTYEVIYSKYIKQKLLLSLICKSMNYVIHINKDLLNINSQT